MGNQHKNNFQVQPKIFALTLLLVFLFGAKTSATKTFLSQKIIFGLYNPSRLQLVSTSYNLSNVKKLYQNSNLGNIFTAQIPPEKFSEFAADADVKYAEKNQEVSAAAFGSTDPFFTTDATAEDKQWYLPKIKLPDAWDYSRGSTSVVVAIIDTGIHASHLDLNDGRVIAGFDETKNVDIAANANSDDNGHGTAIAGVIGAVPNNQKGIVGIDWNISLMPVKVLDSTGSGDIATIASGIVWAADHGASIINLSLGGSGFPNNATLSDAVTYAFNKGALIISAAGNDTANQGSNLDQNPVYPVCEDNGQNMVLGVAASDVKDVKADFSNFGIQCVDITAPGKKIITTAFIPSDPSDNILIYASGTSLATPIVSGVAALIKSANPSYSNTQIRDLILNTADSIDALNQTNCLGSSCNGFLGHGRIDALSALAPQPIFNNTLVREFATGKVYLVSGGIKHYASPFVLTQQFANSQILNEIAGQLANFTNGNPIAPTTGTLVKTQTDPTVYYIDNGVRRPLTYLVFVSRQLSFANVKIMADADLAVIPLADWYWPPDGTLVLIKGNPTVYVMDQGLARPVTYFVFTQRKLSFAKVISVSTDEFSHVPRPADTYWLSPLDGTLVKSATDPTVYVIENQTKHALSGPAFSARGYKFTNVKKLPQAEIDVIAPGANIL